MGRLTVVKDQVLVGLLWDSKLEHRPRLVVDAGLESIVLDQEEARAFSQLIQRMVEMLQGLTITQNFRQAHRPRPVTPLHTASEGENDEYAPPAT